MSIERTFRHYPRESSGRFEGRGMEDTRCRSGSQPPEVENRVRPGTPALRRFLHFRSALGDHQLEQRQTFGLTVDREIESGAVN